MYSQNLYVEQFCKTMHVDTILTSPFDGEEIFFFRHLRIRIFNEYIIETQYTRINASFKAVRYRLSVSDCCYNKSLIEKALSQRYKTWV